MAPPEEVVPVVTPVPVVAPVVAPLVEPDVLAISLVPVEAPPLMSVPVPAVVPAAPLPELMADESEAMLLPSEPEPLVLLVLALSRLLPHPPSSEAPRARATRAS